MSLLFSFFFCRQRKDLDKTKSEKHEKSVNDVKSTISNMTNPFTCEQTGLVNIANGVEVDASTADGMLSAETLGEHQFSEFCQRNLFTDDPDIFNPIKKNKLKTFSSDKAKINNSKGQLIALKTDRNLFARLLVMSKSQNLDLKDLLSYSLSDYPLSLATLTGGLVKTAKSKMFEILNNMVEDPLLTMENIGERNALIVDAFAILHAMKGCWKTFSDFADATFALLIKIACQSKAVRLDFVADRYPVISIKNAERSRRAAQGVQRVRILNKNQSLPKQWKKYMSSGENKEWLVAFLCEYWCTYQTAKLNNLECIYITSKDKCYLLVPGSSPNAVVQHEEVQELESDHEEADTRLLLHSQHASISYDSIIVKCSDTDVFLLCIANQNNIGKPLFFMKGTGKDFMLSRVNIYGCSLLHTLQYFIANVSSTLYRMRFYERLYW